MTTPQEDTESGQKMAILVEDIINPSTVLMAKAVTMIVLCVVSTIMGIIPIQLGKCFKWGTHDKTGNPRSSRIVGMLLGFGGGVLFCTTFLHMLPEVVESVELLTERKELPKFNFPLAEVFVCTGFFIMYLVEEIVHTKLRHREHHVAHQHHPEKDVNHSTNDLVENNEGCAVGHVHHGHSHGYGHGHTHLPAATINDNHDFVISSLRGLLIVLGLSVHELFEGLAIGLEGSANDVWYMFAAVAAHKFVIAFCIGVELVASRTHQCLSIIYVCTFAIVSPMGIGIGMLLVGGDSPAASGPLPVILQGIATGTLLYVVFFEILHHNRDGLHQYLSIIVGFILMFGLQIATSHAHSHGHGHSHGSEHSHEHSHDHDEDHEGHNHTDQHHPITLITDSIDRISTKVANAVTDALVSSTTPSTTEAGHS